MADPRCLAAPPRPPRGPQRFERGRVTRAQMSIGVRLLLGALAVAGGEDSTHHRSASFWNDLDDGSSVPKGAEGASPSALLRLCPAAAASSYPLTPPPPSPPHPPRTP